MREWNDCPIEPILQGTVEELEANRKKLLDSDYVRWSFNEKRNIWHLFDSYPFGNMIDFNANIYTLPECLAIWKEEITKFKNQ